MPDITRREAVTSGFAELVCADAAWLRAEFDAIMSANFDAFPPYPARRRPGSTGPQRSGRRPRAVATGGRLVGVVPAIRGGHRQRSPPLTGALLWSANATVISKGR
ncbi:MULTISPECIES: hypothetical protein [unclassified Amycolatopsis]|uniref:hypothetical protein n=1 Tax=unclassified Amycolatopsis TaxID=2618356 RepID=UPI001C69820B|nr:hypothetical protein [Amycolatopsis sp. DSM 110486]QYN19075.1 hypothetical protein K1T34_41440 [Amycolatopsis sp. DSM 110486]